MKQLRVSTLPNKLERDTEYIITSSEHPSYVFDSETNGQNIVISPENVTQFTGPLIFRTSNYILNGKHGGGYGNWRDDFGFIFDMSNPDQVVVDGENNDINIKHAEFIGLGKDKAWTGFKQVWDEERYRQTGFSASNIFLEDIYMHNILGAPINIRHINGFSFSGCIEDILSTKTNHGEWFSIHGGTHHLFYNSLFKNCKGMTSGVFARKEPVPKHIRFENNIVDNCSTGNGIVFLVNGSEEAIIQNNTILNCDNECGVTRKSDTASNLITQKNVWSNCHRVSIWGKRIKNYLGNVSHNSSLDDTNIISSDSVNIDPNYNIIDPNVPEGWGAKFDITPPIEPEPKIKKMRLISAEADIYNFEELN